VLPVSAPFIAAKCLLAAAFIIDSGVLEIDSTNVEIKLNEKEAGKIIHNLNGKKIIYGKYGNKKEFDDLLLSNL